jgi:nitronate monooxygenase
MASGRHGRGMSAFTAPSSAGDDERVLTTWLTERFKLQVPVVSAPMAGVAGGALARAVSSAGALGMIGYAGHDLAALRAELSVAAEGGGPFGVGFLAWTLGPGDEALLEAATEAGAALVAVSYGDYAPHVERIQAAGAAVATQVGTLDDARRAVDAGVDVLVARGGEGGGHGRDAVATLPLLQAVLDEVDVPVLAAGGIATARGLAAVLAAGAAGAWAGTAFIACDESAYDEARRDGAVEAGLDSTVYTTVFDIGRGSPWPSEFGGRAVRNAFSDTWYGRDEELRAGDVRSSEPVLWAGQAVGLVHARRPAAEVVADFAAAERLLAEVCRGVTGG